MKLFYKNPVISALALNSFSLVFAIYIVYAEQHALLSVLPLSGIANRYLLDNGENLTQNKRKIIWLSCSLMVVIFLIYASYMHRIRQQQIINGF